VGVNGGKKKAIGFSYGSIRGGNFSEVGVNGCKRRAKDDISWFYTEKLGLPSLNSSFDSIASQAKSIFDW
jgi:hypothetical protein